MGAKFRVNTGVFLLFRNLPTNSVPSPRPTFLPGASFLPLLIFSLRMQDLNKLPSLPAVPASLLAFLLVAAVPVLLLSILALQSIGPVVYIFCKKAGLTANAGRCSPVHLAWPDLKLIKGLRLQLPWQGLWLLPE